MTTGGAPGESGNSRVQSGAIWDELCETLRKAGGLVTEEGIPDSPLERAAGFRFLAQFLEAGINFCVSHADGDHPELTRMIDLGMRWGLDSPDCLYLVASVNDTSSYRIWGDVGTANHFDVQVNTGHYALGDIASVRTLGSIGGDELVTSAGGEFELFVGGERQLGNWIPSGPGARFILLRQNFLDWERERPATLRIEKVGGSVAKPNLRSDQIAERIDLLRSWIEKGGGLWQTMSRGLLGLEPNSVVIHAPDDAAEHSGLKGQIYCQGNFRCAPDEAVIFEAVPPPARHWNLSLANFWWEAVDFVHRQGSLNANQAHLDADGVLRVVIAHRDPGVVNWLDPCGHEAGTLILRFILAEGELALPRSRVVALSDLEGALPRGTPRLTPEEREETLRRRRNALWLRYRR